MLAVYGARETVPCKKKINIFDYLINFGKCDYCDEAIERLNNQKQVVVYKKMIEKYEAGIENSIKIIRGKK